MASSCQPTCVWVLRTMKSQPQADATAASMKSMMYMMPLMSVYIAFVMPAALGVYWIAQSVFSLIQEVVLNKTLNAKLEAEEEARFQARQADRQKRMEEARVLEQQRKQEEQKKKTLREKQQAAQAAKPETFYIYPTFLYKKQYLPPF